MNRFKIDLIRKEGDEYHHLRYEFILINNHIIAVSDCNLYDDCYLELKNNKVKIIERS